MIKVSDLTPAQLSLVRYLRNAEKRAEETLGPGRIRLRFSIVDEATISTYYQPEGHKINTITYYFSSGEWVPDRKSADVISVKVFQNPKEGE